MGDYLPFLEEVLSPRRLQHSLSVMKVMGELARVYELDMELAVTAGLLHDAAKDLPSTRINQLVQDADITLFHECDRNYVLYLHGPVGAAFVERELGVKDTLMLAAIESHTSYGRSPLFDHPLCWCLRFADVLEPTRSWKDEGTIQANIQNLQKLVYGGEMAGAVVAQTGMLMHWFKEKGFLIHPNIITANERFSSRMDQEDV